MSDPKQTGPFEGEGSFVPHGDDHHPPQQIGRYRTEKLLGKGDFWVVYQAYDEYLDRSVAIKVPRLDRVSRPGEAEAYLDKARVLAMLNHPHIVPLHEVSITEDGLFFVVSKLITGNDLATIIQAFRLLPDESAEVVGSVAEALHYVHQRGLVHRDVKPGNILIDYSGTPYLTGFGLALKEEDYSQGGVVCGTPAYMSPEHANGEGHRVDGRSDIFSLGVVFYELLAGRRPFLGEGAEVLTQIIMDEPPPPREIECTIPRELERICLKAWRSEHRIVTPPPKTWPMTCEILWVLHWEIDPQCRQVFRLFLTCQLQSTPFHGLLSFSVDKWLGELTDS